MTLKEYQEEQRKKLQSIVVGGKDRDGYIIKEVYSRGDEYVIYEVESDDIAKSIVLRILTKTPTDTTGIIANYNKVRAKFGEVRGLLYKASKESCVKLRIAQTITEALHGHPDDAIKEFDELEDEINKDYKDLFDNKLHFLTITMALCVLNIVAAYFTYLYFGKNWWGQFPHVTRCIYVATSGSIGAIISIFSRVKDLSFEKGIDSAMYFAYGAERIIVAMFAAVIVYFAIQADIAFSFLNKLPFPVYGYVFAGCLAGFSESFVPNLLIKFEEKE